MAQAPDEELLALLLGRRPPNTLKLSRLLEFKEEALLSAGFSVDEAARIAVTAEIARRHQPGFESNDQVTDPRQLVSRLVGLRQSASPKMIAFFLDPYFRCQTSTVIGLAGAGCAAVPTDELVRLATAGGASALVVAHNHLTERSEPTLADLEFTSKLLSTCRDADVELADHVIVTGRSWFSLRRARLLD